MSTMIRVLSLLTLPTLAWAEDAAEEAPPAEVVPASDSAPAEPAGQPAQPVAAPAGPHRAIHRFGDSGWSIDSAGSWRNLVSTPPDFVVDDEGNRVGQGAVLDTRIRASLGVQWKAIRAETEWDMFSGQIAGDTWDIPVSLDARRRDALTAATREGFVPRRASLLATVADGFQIEAGLMPARTWGLGILANGGEADPLFGRTDRGDRMLRLRLTTFPVKAKGGTQTLPLFFTLGFDKVVEDDTAEWRLGQHAYQVIASVLWNDPMGRKGGVFYTFRTQDEPGALPRPTNVSAVDGYFDIPVALGETGWKVRVAAEGAGIFGTTQRVLAYADPTSTKIASGGFAGVLDFVAPEQRIHAMLRSGYASASGDPDSGQLHDFTFDANFDVGMILFDQLMGGIEAGTYALLDDREHSGGPPLGADGLLTEGSFRRSFYLQPAVTARVVPGIELRAGVVTAWSTGPIAQPFYTFRAGGQPTNHLNQPTQGRWMGAELDWALVLGDVPALNDWWIRPRLLVQGGHAFVGENLGGGVLNEFMLTAQLEW